MTSVLPLLPDADDVRVARNFCVREVSDVIGCEGSAEDVIEDAAMITSELVTNAIRAGARHIELHVDCSSNAVRIAVVDDADGDVVPRSPDPLALGGRGLRIVESLSERWGVALRPPGKSVWADLRVPGRVTAGSTHLRAAPPPERLDATDRLPVLEES